MEKNLQQIEKYTLYATAILVPAAVLPIFPNAFTTIKLILLTAAVSLVLLTKVAQVIAKGSLDLRVAKFDAAVLLIAVAYAVSGYFRTPNRMEAFFIPGTAILVVACVLFYFLVNQLKSEDKNQLSLVFFFSGVLVALSSLFAILGVFRAIPQLPEFMKVNEFNTMGGNIPAALYLATLIPLGLGFVSIEKDMARKALSGVSLIIISFGLIVNIYNILPGKPASPRFHSFAISWSIAVDALKESPFLGVGPANYLTAFNRFRPVSYNQTDLWAVRFTSARDFYLTLLTETGLLGAAGLILLLIAVYRMVQTELKENRAVGWGVAGNTKLISLLVILVALALFASSPSLLLLAFALLAINAKTKTITLNLSAQGIESGRAQGLSTRIPAILVSVPILVGVLYYVFVGARVVSAESTYQRALNALAANDGGTTYNLLTQAINKNPQIDRYHATFAQINLALTNNFTQVPEGEQISEQDRNTVSQLIQQSINEGKSTVALNPTRSGNWALLGSLYRSIMTFAEGADSFAVQTYTQAVALDPVSPDLRIDLGGIYFALQDYNNAIDTFRVATLAKPDLANAHYNLAVALREDGQIERAIQEMNTTLSLVERDSNDYQIVKQELDALEARRPATTEEAQSGETLNPPQGAEESAIEPPLELPEDAQPPEPPEETQPSPSPTASPEATPLP